MKNKQLAAQLKIVRPKLTLEEYKQFWRKKKEATVTSPFGLHVGHYKAALQQEEILNVHRLLLLIPFQTGLVPYRWKKTVQTLLEKDPGHPWIHRLRIIELFDSQVNAGFQIFIGRKMVWEAVRNNKLHPASFGSTPGKMAASAVLQKILLVDQLRIERRAGGMFDCDAKGCYDRIIPPLASIHLQALSLDKSIATLLARLMFTAKRFVKTKHGVSKNSIRTTRESPLFGIGQGNGGGPAIWLAHLTVMFTALSSICTGFMVGCIKGLEILTTVGTGYVDDVTLFVSLDPKEPQTEEQVKKRIQRMASKWEKLLFLTGGKLELSKCFWLPITWNWRHGEPVVKGTRDSPVELHLTESESRTKINIPRIAPSTAEKRLGIRYSADGKWAKEYKYWLDFTKDFAITVRKARLDRLGGYQAYKALWCAKFRYSAPVIGLSKQQLLKIQKQIIGTSLAAAGYSSKMPRAIVFGPSLFGGMQWESPYSILLAEQIKLVIGSLRMEDTVGKLLNIQLQWIQLAVGLSTPVLEAKTTIPYVPHCWIKLLHEKLVDTNITIQTSTTWIPEDKRANDQIIMDFVTRHLPPKSWGEINQCRLYLKAITLSDITTFDGAYIPDSVYRVAKPYRDSSISFPKQKRPSKAARHEWQYLIRFVSDTNGKLHTPLGKWIRSPYQHFPVFMGPDKHKLFKRVNRVWERYVLLSGTRNIYTGTGDYSNHLPIHRTPINVIKLSNQKLQAIIPEDPLVGVSDEQQSVLGRFRYDHIKRIVVTYIISKDQLTHLAAAWHTQKVELVCGSDGGLKNNIGTSGYVLCLGSSAPVIYGFAAEQQYSDTSSSTRQELLAQLSIEYWVAHLVEIFGVPRETVQITLVTDSQASIQILDSITKVVGMKPLLKPDWEVAMEITRQRSTNPHCHFEMQKVISHIAVEEAPDEVYWRVNDAADKLATRAREEVETGALQAKDPVFLSGYRAVCCMDNRLCLWDLNKTIQKRVSQADIQEFLCIKYSWTRQIFKGIDWQAHTDALARYPLLPQVTVMKLIHGWLATKKRGFHSGTFLTPQCILCEEDEDSTHIYCCQTEEIRNARDRAWRELDDKIKMCTTPNVGTAITACLRSVTGRIEAATYREEFATDDSLILALSEQEGIGWKHFLLGRISSKWKAIGPSENFTGTRKVWARNIVTAVLDFGLQLWKRRNLIIHGNYDGGPSKLTQARTEAMIIQLYEELLPNIHPSHGWLFNTSREAKLQEPHTIQIAWIDSVRRIYPGKYSELRTQLGSMDFRQDKVEYAKSVEAQWR